MTNSPSSNRYTGLADQYRNRLPLAEDTVSVCLGEGATPLIRLENIPAQLGLDADVYVKFEGLNPTGSFKDRGMSIAVTQARAEGSEAIVCASTGNTSAAAAAYAKRAGLRAFVLIPDGKIAHGKLAQAIMHGAEVIQIHGNFDDGMKIVRELGEHTPLAIVNSINPFRLQGQKTAAFEIVEALGRAPDYHCLPVGNAGNISAYWIGYSEVSGYQDDVKNMMPENFGYDCDQLTDQRPVMCGYQAAGAAPFIQGGPVDNPETVATAIRIGHPQSWDLALQAQRDSSGWFDAIPDEEILATQRLLAANEGVFCEPASAASLAGALRDLKAAKISAGSTVVCTLTGNGLKDPDIVFAGRDVEVATVNANLADVRAAMGL